MKNLALCFLLATTIMACSGEETSTTVPTAKKHPVPLELHGDTRVDNYYWLREHKTDSNMLVLKTDMTAGHSGTTGRFRRIEDTALYYAFFIGLEGIRE